MNRKEWEQAQWSNSHYNYHRQIQQNIEQDKKEAWHTFRQALLWFGFIVSLSVMFAGMTETAPGSGVYDWNVLSRLLMFPNFIGLVAVPTVSILWAINKPKPPANTYTSDDARRAWEWAMDWEENLEAEVRRQFH